MIRRWLARDLEKDEQLSARSRITMSASEREPEDTQGTSTRT